MESVLKSNIYFVFCNKKNFVKVGIKNLKKKIFFFYFFFFFSEKSFPIEAEKMVATVVNDTFELLKTFL